MFFRAILEIIRCQKLMFRKGEEILSIYGYSRVSTSNQDYKTQIQKLEQAGA
ncbi:recombinase family protein, partial [Enterococcus faecalis]|nr:recombinase family protein [Enterococcus faecalis]MDK4419231.1 recombinase family protein [Enterococcus faecalis]MDT2185563.1 recombinase family protein [Enterococcus faecalis]